MNKYLRLMRVDKPIGIYLLLYPTLWALILAGAGVKEYVIFILGVVLMRSGGCVINDFADRKIDKLVTRTQHRPLTTGEITSKNALILFFVLMSVAFILVLFTNTLTVLLSFVAVFLATIYPFSKRWFAIPQLFLGLAFAMSVPMAFAATLGFVPVNAWLVFGATIMWTIIYDTQYAMSDREEDLKIAEKIGKKIRSSAIFFGRFDVIIVSSLQIMLLGLLAVIGYVFELNIWYFLSIVIVAGLFIYHYTLIKDREKHNCFTAFLHNNYVGLVLTNGIALSYFL